MPPTMTMTAVAPATAMTVAPPPRMCLLNHNPMVRIPVIDPKRDNRRPEEEQDFHDPDRKASLQHATCLVQVVRERVIHLPTRESEWSECVIDTATVPAAAVGVCDEAQLVYACDEGAEEEEVDEGDE